jgi:hypothetical protein
MPHPAAARQTSGASRTANRIAPTPAAEPLPNLSAARDGEVEAEVFAMQRVHIDELDAHPEEGGCCIRNDEPITGVVYEMWTDSIPKLEYHCRNGLVWGPQRTWGRSGEPLRAWYEIEGFTHGVSRLWYAPGRLLKLTIYRYGVVVRSRMWDKQGRVIEDYTVPEGGREAEDVRELEAQRRDVVEAEDIPAEFLELTEQERALLNAPAGSAADAE